jgi:hypothetical protein
MPATIQTVLCPLKELMMIVVIKHVNIMMIGVVKVIIVVGILEKVISDGITVMKVVIAANLAMT